MKQIVLLLILSFVMFISVLAQKPLYLVDHMNTADPSAHVFNGKIYVYPSHDIVSGIAEDNWGSQYDMKDYHVLSMDSVGGKITDNGVGIDIKDVRWAGRQMWAPDCAFANGKYYLYFPVKDMTDIFRMGVAVSDKPTGPFIPEPDPIIGSYSIDPAVFGDDDGSFYMYFGGLNGGQLQHYSNNKAVECAALPADTALALCPMVVKMSKDMLQFAEAPREVIILDKYGKQLLAGDNEHRFFEASWMHKYKGKYYFSYSTGDTHKLCYAIGNSPYGPFTYTGVILTPVVGWTTHHSIVEFNGKWYLFYHDSKRSGGISNLRSVKVRELHYNPDGTIVTMDGME